MTEKRYFLHKHLMKEDKVHDKICHQFMNLTETIEHMNMYYQKYTDLKKENEQLKIFLEALREELSLADRDNDALEKENEQLKQLLEDDITRRCEIKEVCEKRWGKLND